MLFYFFITRQIISGTNFYPLENWVSHQQNDNVLHKGIMYMTAQPVIRREAWNCDDAAQKSMNKFPLFCQFEQFCTFQRQCPLIRKHLVFSGWCEKLLLSSFLWEFVRRIIMIKCQQEVKKLGFHFRLFNEVVWMCLWLGWDIIHTAVNYMFLVEK